MSRDPLSRMQRGLEALYRVDSGVDVRDFLVAAARRDDLELARKPREQLLLRQDDGELSIGLYVDATTIANLIAHDPSHKLGEHNFGDFLLALEGVSHFVYTVYCAARERAVSALELELQAEVDKYVTCVLITGIDDASGSTALRRRLFHDVQWEDGLDQDEASRYRAANDNADRYASWLQDSFVAPRKIPEMLAELRRFYRRPLSEKLAVIARAA